MAYPDGLVGIASLLVRGSRGAGVRGVAAEQQRVAREILEDSLLETF